MGKLAPDFAGTEKRRPGIVAVVGCTAAGFLLAAAVWWFFSPDAETLSTRAGQAFMARRFGDAEADLARLRKLRDPQPLDLMLEAQLAMVRSEGVQGPARDRSIDEALAALAKVPDGYEMAARARLQAGQLELRRSRFVPAERWLRESIRLDPDAVQARRELVFIYGMQLRRAELNALFRELSRVSTLTYAEVFLWCLVRGVSWEPAEIVENLKKCVDADPSDRWSRLGMAESLRELHRLDEAEAALAPLPESDVAARAARVRLALDRGDDQGAEALLAAGPADDVDLAMLRGRFALARGDGEEAVRQYRIAYGKAPNLREAVLGLGQALKTTGKLDEATPLLEEARKHERLASLVVKAAVEKDRDDPALMRDLGEVCTDLGRFAEARAWYNLAITRDILDIKAQEGLGRAKDLEAKARARAGPK